MHMHNIHMGGQQPYTIYMDNQDKSTNVKFEASLLLIKVYYKFQLHNNKSIHMNRVLSPKKELLVLLLAI
jgi:hypothetical protein